MSYQVRFWYIDKNDSQESDKLVDTLFDLAKKHDSKCFGISGDREVAYLGNCRADFEHADSALVFLRESIDLDGILRRETFDIK